MHTQQKLKGFTLIEILLVLVIVGIILVAGANYVQQRALQMRMDRTSMQMQQILNAGLSYYVANGQWPADLPTLQGTYLPPSTVALNNPWGQTYSIASSTTSPQLLYVYTSINVVSSKGAYAAANSIAGTLPLAYTSNDSAGTPPSAGSPCTTSDTTCYVVAAVNIPGQNLNNASAVNFAGLYHNGACVPVPDCPVDKSGTTMTPEIIVAPVQVTGASDTTDVNNIYPISSFTAFAIGPASAPTECSAGEGAPTCTGGSPSNQFWRVCLQVNTENGILNHTLTTTGNSTWGQQQTVMAITRCSITNEPSGDPFTSFTN